MTFDATQSYSLHNQVARDQLRQDNKQVNKQHVGPVVNAITKQTRRSTTQTAMKTTLFKKKKARKPASMTSLAYMSSQILNMEQFRPTDDVFIQQ